MLATLTRPSELGCRELVRWRAFQRSATELDDPFLTPEFTSIVARHRDDVRVVVVEDAGVTVGFLSLQVDGDGGAAPVGAGICDLQALIHKPGLEWDPAAVVATAGLRHFRFDHLLASQSPWAPHHRSVHHAPSVDLTGGYEPFGTQHLSRKLVKAAAAARRRLERDLGPVLVTDTEPVSEALAFLKRWKSEQYRRTGVWDRFEQRWLNQVLDDLSETRTDHFRGVVTTLRAGDRLAAVHLGIATNGVLAYWFPTYDPALARYSPGMLLLLDLIRRAADSGLHAVRLGRGNHAYKLRVANDAVQVAEGALTIGR